jgi:hypothetical protein
MWEWRENHAIHIDPLAAERGTGDSGSQSLMIQRLKRHREAKQDPTSKEWKSTQHESNGEFQVFPEATQ